MEHYETAPEDRIPFHKKLAYGSGAFVNNLLADSIGRMVIVLNLGLGMNPAIAGLLAALPRLTDAITDPLMGYISDNTRTRWGRRRPYIFFGAIAIGGAFIARWRVGSVKRHVPELADEVRTLVSEGRETGRTVIDTFTVDADGDGSADGLDGGSALVIGRNLHGFRSLTASGLESSARMTAAVTALTSFPALIAATIVITLVFAFLGVIFLIALAL